MKSGKAVLRIPLQDGQHVDYSLEEGIRSGFYQEVASLDGDQMCILGQVQNKLVATPDLQTLFS